MFRRSCCRPLMLAIVMLLSTLLAVPGCRKRDAAENGAPARKSDRPPVKAQDHEYTLSVVVDMSGSFDRFMQEGARAYRFLMRAVADFFKSRLGARDRILISQVSATQHALLWHGSPRALRQEFGSAEKFNQFLVQNANPNGSLIHRGIGDSLEYLLSDPGVASGKTKTALLILSDMEDNERDGEAAKARLLKLLADYAKKDGVVGMYWVQRSLTPLWRQHLQEAQLRSFIVESDIVADPALPKFD